MTLYEYSMLSDDAQWDELWANGKFITHYKSIDYKCSLYALNKFYVEVELNVINDKILGKHIFKQGHRLEKYVNYLEI